ncbi:hypothetical protein N7532_003044 [Penicillium argentinense]|uniref:RING-type domain-containing protein n=1 Tax=Penicillium argentinense TaxID=1131581 RepID=A0A9W9FM90_9EURO|nr:uncharacterized protein N7532_003044 [Penicillium argentinense]KAJ5102515.1 hypothetical protein N7532_003044 [Penicillium argentinense]
MAAADPPAGLLDIARYVPSARETPGLHDLTSVASTLSPDEIPSKLRCAICNKLAVNAFRLPCCDQSICEACQTTLVDTCPVCAHTPVSPDICKPNKALRTTLKAFLRTEEKKREKERQSAATPTPVAETPAENEHSFTEARNDPDYARDASSPVPKTLLQPEATVSNQAHAEGASAGSAAPETVPECSTESNEPVVESKAINEPTETAPSEQGDHEMTNGNAMVEGETISVAPEGPLQGQPQQSNVSMMNMGSGSFLGTGWNGMNPYMSNMANMYSFPNAMGTYADSNWWPWRRTNPYYYQGMPMAMNPMAAGQGMFGGYGMNMTGMGMNMGVNFNGSGMYGSSGWDDYQQSMWQGGQDNFNPNAFANGTGPPHGGAFGGSNMSYPSNSDYQSGYYGPDYGRGGFRGGFRGGGRGRGGFGGSGPGYSLQNANSDCPSLADLNGEPTGPDGAVTNGGESQGNEGNTGPPASDDAVSAIAHPASDEQQAVGEQLQGIPTIDSLDQPASNGHGPMGSGFGRGGFRDPAGRGGGPWGGSMHGSYQPPMPPKPPVVEGAPAAPRGMRQGLPNTSMLRQRGYQQGRSQGSNGAPSVSQRSVSDTISRPETSHEIGLSSNAEHSGTPELPKDPSPPVSLRSPSRTQPATSRSRSRSPAPSRDSHSRSKNDLSDDNDSSSRRERQREPKESAGAYEDRMEEHRSLDRHQRDSERGRREDYRGHRSRRHRTRDESHSHSPSRNGDGRHNSRISRITGNPLKGHRASSEAGESRGLADRIGSRRSSKDRSGRRDDNREHGKDRDRARDSRRRERDRRGRDGDATDRDRRRDRDRDREREREGPREHGRGREGRNRDSKRSRRDRSESAHLSDHTSRPQPRRVKREPENNLLRDSSPKPEKEKDPYTLEREARNRERLLREQQNRGAKFDRKTSRR